MRKKNNCQLTQTIPDGEGSIALPIVFVPEPVIIGNLRLRSNPGLPRRRLASLQRHDS